MAISSAHLAKWHDRILKSLPLASIGCFAATVAFLAHVFDSWGLSVVQLAAPGDILMPGLVFGALLMLTISLPASVALLIDLTRRGAIGRVRMVVMTIIVGLSAAFWWPWGVAGLTAGWVSMVVASGCALHVLCNREWRAPPGPVEAVMLLILAAAPLTWFGAAFVSMIDLVGTQGLGNGAMLPASEKTPCAGRLLWLGEKAIVVRCSDEALGVRAMTPEGLHIRPAQRPD